MGREIHVSKHSLDGYRTISEAAQAARAGDTVIVHEGVYREWVKPLYGGSSNINRIIYQAVEGEKVEIKGSEVIKTWEPVDQNVWKVTLPNSFFGEYNPYSEVVFGDWFRNPLDMQIHCGEIYLNGKSFYEAKTLKDVIQPKKRVDGYNPAWTNHRESLPYPEDTLYQWYCEADQNDTTIYANFQGADPNRETVEINVRKCCFYPDRPGRDYITVRGFEMTHAATPWTPPTADQPGLLGAHWSKGWIIEDNVIHDSKCSGISIGKEESTGHNLCTETHRKPGYQYQMEAVFKALKIGWSKEKIGSHIIRNNTIYDCGQNGIVGHMGCVFSEIANNHIYNIGVKHEFFGHEIAGIKLHACIDVRITNNNIHNSTLGMWLDWQVQGTRVSKNLFYANNRDLMIEVTHGPHLVDHNIFASDYNLDNFAWGGAFVNNLLCGSMRRVPMLNRATPYHYPHSTEVAGVTFVYGGDDRWYQNIFIGGDVTYTEQSSCGTKDYNNSPKSLEMYIELLAAKGNGDLEIYEQIKDPVYIKNNAYFRGAEAYNKEAVNIISNYDPEVKITEVGGSVYLEIVVNQELIDMKGSILETKDLGLTRITEGAFENPDGSNIIFDTDYNEELRSGETPIGPLSCLKTGLNKIKVWG